MNFNSTYLRKAINEDGDIEITLSVKGYKNREEIKLLEKDCLYRVALSKVKSKRSIEQNNLMWSLIHEISLAENGEMATSDDDWEVYLSCLEKAQAKYEIIACLPNALELLKSQFRAIRELNEFEHKGKTFKQVQVFYGSSKMDSKEMTKLLDVVIERAGRNGIELNEQIYY